MTQNINYYWTSKKPINGLRHFVLINKFKKNYKVFFQLVSVLDVEISLEVSKEDLMSRNNWQSGWLDLPKHESITKDYFENKLNQKTKCQINEIFLKDDSLFYIS